jgi:hypothetical protein
MEVRPPHVRSWKKWNRESEARTARFAAFSLDTRSSPFVHLVESGLRRCDVGLSGAIDQLLVATGQWRVLIPPPPSPGCSPVDVTHTEDQGSEQASDYSAWSMNLEDRVELTSSAFTTQGFSASATTSGSFFGGVFVTENPLVVVASSGDETTTSLLVSVFEVDEPTLYNLVAEVGAAWSGWSGAGSGKIRLLDSDDQEIENLQLVSDFSCTAVNSNPRDPLILDASGILPPGVYRVEAENSGSALGGWHYGGIGAISIGNTYGGSFQTTLSFPTPAPASEVPGLILLVMVLLGLGGRVLRTKIRKTTVA